MASASDAVRFSRRALLAAALLAAAGAVHHLPRRLSRRGGEHALHLELLEAHASAPAGWPQPAAASEGFVRLDAADFGDMDNDPLVRQLMARDERAGWRPPASR